MKRLAASCLLLACLVGASPAAAEEKWKGIDEAVIEKFAEERGRSAREPLLNLEGDLLLFVFTLAGAVGGFVIGYFWHKLFVAGRQDEKRP